MVECPICGHMVKSAGGLHLHKRLVHPETIVPLSKVDILKGLEEQKAKMERRKAELEAAIQVIDNQLAALRSKPSME